MALELNQHVITSHPLPAATVMVLRDSATGPEVLMLRRSSASGVLGGAFVFPGGKVDPVADVVEDAHIDPGLDELLRRLNEADLPRPMAGSLFAAAVRETLEECDLLLGYSGASPDVLARAACQLREGQPVSAVMGSHGWRLNVQALHPWSRWITPQRPSVTNRRFDTRFFVTAVPDGQTAVHDGHETTESLWTTPRQALQKYVGGQIELAPPQIMSLLHLGQFGSVDAILTRASAHTPRTIRPEPIEENGHRVLCYPGDPMHCEPSPAWAGPTRLTFRNQRFEPEGGWEAYC